MPDRNFACGVTAIFLHGGIAGDEGKERKKTSHDLQPENVNRTRYRPEKVAHKRKQRASKPGTTANRRNGVANTGKKPRNG